jgi:hypothetical protein
VQIKLYNTDDRGGIFSRALTLPNGTKTIPANSEVAFQEREFTGLLLPTISAATVVLSRSQERDINVGSLVNITAAGTLDVTEYTPPNPWVNEQAFRDLANGRSLWVESNQKPIPVMTASPSWLSLLLN